MKKLLWGILVIFLPLTAAAKEHQKDYSEAFKLIDVWLDAQRDFDRLPGISLAVVEGQETIWSDAYGCANMEDGVPSTPSTIGSICSISKLFTSISIMKLYDDGKLRLDDRIEDLLPWYNLDQGYPHSGPVTVRTLLTHSSGLPREANFPYWIGPYPFPDREQIIEAMSRQQTLYPSSTYFQYSNLAMTLLGEIVAEVSGVPYDDFVYSNIIGPLGLTDTRTVLPEDLYGDQLAYGYTVLLRDGTRLKDELFQANGIMAAAGFSSTVVDLAAFASWHFRLLDSDTPEILKPSTLRYMLNVHYTDPGWETTWGLGYAVRRGSGNTKWVGHGGYCPGYQSVLQMHPDSKRAYSVIINANGVSPIKYAMGVHEILDEASANSNNKEQEAIPNLTEYTGFYLYNHSERYISTWNSQLVMLSLPSDSPVDDMTYFKHLESDTFYRVRPDGSRGEPLEFSRDGDGNIYQYTLHQMHSTKINR